MDALNRTELAPRFLRCADDGPDVVGLRQENAELKEHIRAVQKGSEVAQQLVLDQFREVDRILSLLQSENALRKSLLDATDQLSIIYADLGGTVRLFNRGAENLLGYGADEVIDHRSLLDFHLPDEIEAIESLTGVTGVHALIAVTRRGLVHSREWSYRDKTGKAVSVKLSVSPVRDDDEAITGLVCSAMDITEIKAAEQALRASEARYRELSITDGLTRLYNVRHFHQQLEIEIERAQRYGPPLSLLLLDVDNFKSFNDTYGHVEGDRVLIRMGEVIRNCLRRTDSAYRYGGEEFVLLLPETDLAGAQIVAERLRSLTAEQVYHPQPAAFERRTVSIGGTAYRPGEPASHFVRRADACTYKAKHAGKNRVVMEE